MDKAIAGNGHPRMQARLLAQPFTDRIIMNFSDPAALLLIGSLLGFLVLIAAIVGVAVMNTKRRK